MNIERRNKLAVRLTVVIVQGVHRASSNSDYEQEVLTRVMLEQNLDAVLVGPFEQMDPDGTDVLCLSKLPPGSVLLSWLKVPEVQEHCRRLELPWASSAEKAQPTIRFRQLALSRTVDQLIGEVLELLRDANVRPLQISMPTQQKLGKVTENVQPETTFSAIRPILTAPGEIRIEPKSTSSSARTEQRDGLDQLVDELESLDL